MASLSAAVFAQLGLGATNVPSASAGNGAARDPLVIDCKATVAKRFPSPARGPCTISGAVTDRGRFVDDDLLGVPHDRNVFGRKGTIAISLRGDSSWVIVQGTKAYAELRARGSESRSRRCQGSPNRGCDVFLTMTGPVVP